MPVTVPEAIARAEAFVRGATHPDYARTVAHAQLCRKLATGDIGSLLRRFVAGESAEEFLTRQALTVPTVSAVWHELVNPFYQVSRLKGSQVERRFDYAEEVSEAEATRRRARLLGAVDRYFEGRPLEDYLSERVVAAVAMTDPNAYVLTEFSPYDFRTAMARPYPVLVPCENVVDFTKDAGELTSVTFRWAVVRAEATGWRYTVYLGNEVVDYWPVLTVSGQLVYTMPEGYTVAGQVLASDGSVGWQYRILTHNAGRVPAACVGYVLDKVTDLRTYVSPLNPAVCFLEEQLTTESEMQITMKKVVNPHKSQFVDFCPGDPNLGCIDGYTRTGNNVCGICHGTGRRSVQSSSLQVTEFTMPKSLEDMSKLDLSKMVNFQSPPIEVPKWQKEYIDYLVTRCQRTLFNTETLSQTTVTRTATERLAENEQKNVALAPMAECLSRLYVHQAHVCAAYVDVAQGLAVTYEFPPNLLPPSLADLEANYAEATKAGFDALYLETLYRQIIQRRFADNPEELKRMTTKLRHIPYIGLSDEQFLKYAALGYVSVDQRTRRIEQDSIFYELELETPAFYQLAPKAQDALVAAKVAEKVKLLAPSAATAAPRLTLPPVGAAATAV
jgi:hypothetical protein